MVQIVENWTDVVGTVDSPVREGTVAGHSSVTLTIEREATVDGFPNLMAGWQGRTVEVFVPAAAAASIGVEPGIRVSLRLRRSDPGRVFAHPERIRRL